MQHVLLETTATEKYGVPVYFYVMTGIGPSMTRDFQTAQQFASSQEAMRSPAFCFSLCNFYPVEADEESIWTTLTEPDD